MIPLVYLVLDDRRHEWLNALMGAFFVCLVLSALWLVLAFLGKGKGRPLELSYGFWCLAGPGWLGLTVFLVSLFQNLVASMVILVPAIGLPVLLVVKKSQPNKPPEAMAVKRPPSNQSLPPACLTFERWPKR